MSGCYFFHIVFAYRKFPHLGNTSFISCDGSDEFIGFVIIFADTICRFDIFCSIDFKCYFSKRAGNIFKNMLHGAFGVLHKRYIIQELALLIDDQKCSRNFVLHFHFLNFRSIFYRELYVSCLQISVRSKFLTKSVSFADNKSFDHMRLILYGSPAVDDIAILIKYGKGCTIKLYASCDIRLSEFKGCRFILFDLV